MLVQAVRKTEGLLQPGGQLQLLPAEQRQEAALLGLILQSHGTLNRYEDGPPGKGSEPPKLKDLAKAYTELAPLVSKESPAEAGPLAPHLVSGLEARQLGFLVAHFRHAEQT